MTKQLAYSIPNNVMSGVELQEKITGALKMYAEGGLDPSHDLGQAGVSAAAETLQEYVADLIGGIEDQAMARAIYIDLGERLTDIGASANPLPRGGNSHGIAFSI